MLTLGGGGVRQWFLEYEENKNKESRGAGAERKKKQVNLFLLSCFESVEKELSKGAGEAAGEANVRGGIY